MSIDNTSFISS